MNNTYTSKVTIYTGSSSLCTYTVGQNCLEIEYTAGTSGVEVTILFSTGSIKIYRGNFAYELEQENV